MCFCIGFWQDSKITYEAILENDRVFYMLSTQVLSHQEKKKKKKREKRNYENEKKMGNKQ